MSGKVQGGSGTVLYTGNMDGEKWGTLVSVKARDDSVLYTGEMDFST